MPPILVFIRKYATIILFLFLEIISLFVLFTYNKYHRSVASEALSEVSATINQPVQYLYSLFDLRKENMRLHEMNLKLLASTKTTIDSSKATQPPIADSGRMKRYKWTTANIVMNCVAAADMNNLIQINKGRNDGIKTNMAIVSSYGTAVGIVVATSSHFSQVMSLLNVKAKLSASLKSDMYFGNVYWDGVNPSYIYLKGVPSDIKVNKGDSIVTSEYSTYFPPDIMIGTVTEKIKDPESGFFKLKIKSATNFYNLQQVFVVENMYYDEQTKLLEQTKIQ